MHFLTQLHVAQREDRGDGGAVASDAPRQHRTKVLQRHTRQSRAAETEDHGVPRHHVRRVHHVEHRFGGRDSTAAGVQRDQRCSSDSVERVDRGRLEPVSMDREGRPKILHVTEGGGHAGQGIGVRWNSPRVHHAAEDLQGSLVIPAARVPGDHRGPRDRVGLRQRI